MVDVSEMTIVLADLDFKKIDISYNQNMLAELTDIALATIKIC